jgi:hypothetical protein
MEPHQQLAFITILDQASIKDPARQQEARTQAIRHSLGKKRRELQLNAQNFVDETPASLAKRRKKRPGKDIANDLPRRSASFQTKEVDPFDCIAVNATRLTSLLRHKAARQAGEPVFSVNDTTEYQRIHSVFNAGCTYSDR